MNVEPSGLIGAVSVTWSPSWSVADTPNVISVFSGPPAVAGAVTTGARLPAVTVRVVAAVAVPAVGVFVSVAVQLILNVPVCAALGVPVNVMLGLNEGPALDE